MMPKITVLMAEHNTNKEFLIESIESVLNQTFEDFEFIIVDDQTNEDNRLILSDYSARDKRVRIIKNESNLGLTASLNRGLEAAQSDYVARMDSDDVCMKTRLQVQYNYMKNHKDVLVLGGLSRELGSNKIVLKPVNDFEILKMRMLFYNCAMVHPTAFINWGLLKKLGLKYDENISKSQDYMLWSQCMLSGKIEVLNTQVLFTRIHDNQITKKYSDEQKACSMLIQNSIIQNYFGESMKESDQILHYQIIFGIIDNKIKKIEQHFLWLIELNREKGVFRISSFEKECCYIWLIMCIKASLYYKDFSWIKAKFTWKAITSVGFWTYYVKQIKNID